MLTEDDVKARESVREALQRMLGPRLELPQAAVEEFATSREEIPEKLAKAAAKSKA